MKYLLFIVIFLSNVCLANPTLLELKETLESVTNVEARSYSTQDFGRVRFEKAVSVLVPEKESKTYLNKVRSALPSGSFAFIGTTRNLSKENVVGVEIVVISSSDKFDILRASYSDGINYGLTNEKIIDKLKEWDKAYDIDIWQAETDTIQFTFKSLPEDVPSFTSDVYKFCPDIVDQGSGNISDLIRYIKGSKSLYLWWD